MHIPRFSDAAKVLSFWPTIQQTLSGVAPSTQVSTERLIELPGGSPFSLCPVSRPTDLFNISYVELSKQPVFIDEVVFVHKDGFLRSGDWSANATVNATVDCGSHCEIYGAPPGERLSESYSIPFCEFSRIQQEVGGRIGHPGCVAEKGRARISSMAYAFPLAFHAPAWYNFTFDAKTAEGERIYCLTAEVCLRWEDPKKNKHIPQGPWSDCRWPR